MARMIVRQMNRSSAIERLGWNPITEELHILFRKNGRYPEYIYGGVQRELAERFMMARSAGTFFHDYIKDKGAYQVRKPLGSFKLGAIGRRVRNLFGFRKK